MDRNLTLHIRPFHEAPESSLHECHRMRLVCDHAKGGLADDSIDAAQAILDDHAFSSAHNTLVRALQRAKNRAHAICNHELPDSLTALLPQIESRNLDLTSDAEARALHSSLTAIDHPQARALAVEFEKISAVAASQHWQDQRATLDDLLPSIAEASRVRADAPASSAALDSLFGAAPAPKAQTSATSLFAGSGTEWSRGFSAFGSDTSAGHVHDASCNHGPGLHYGSGSTPHVHSDSCGHHHAGSSSHSTSSGSSWNWWEGGSTTDKTGTATTKEAETLVHSGTVRILGVIAATAAVGWLLSRRPDPYEKRTTDAPQR